MEMPAAEICVPLWGGSFGISADARMCYDERALYLRLSAVEKAIRAEHTEPWEAPCEDSCLEFFFCPLPGDARYFNVEFNPNGCLFLGMGSGIFDLVRLTPLQEDLFAFSAARDETGWSVSYEIPHAFVRQFFPQYAPAAGMKLRGNFYKCGDLTENPHFLAWNPVREEGGTFHQPADFGTLLFL